MNNIGEKIKEARIHQNLSQDALAELSNVSIRTIQRIESGQVTPRISTLNLLLKTLNIEFTEVPEENESSNKLVKQLKAMNLFIILSLPIPLLNLFVSFSFWGIFSKYKLQTDAVKKMISFQIIWCIITVLVFFFGVFTSNLITKNAGNSLYIGLNIYVLCILYNMYSISKNTIQLNKGAIKPIGVVPNFF